MRSRQCDTKQDCGLGSLTFRYRGDQKDQLAKGTESQEYFFPVQHTMFGQNNSLVTVKKVSSFSVTFTKNFSLAFLKGL